MYNSKCNPTLSSTRGPHIGLCRVCFIGTCTVVSFFALYRIIYNVCDFKGTLNVIESMQNKLWPVFFHLLRSQCPPLFLQPMHSPRLFSLLAFGVTKSSYTSRKHGTKEPQSFFHCGSFDHHGLQSHNDYKNLIFILQLQYYMFWGM